MSTHVLLHMQRTASTDLLFRTENRRTLLRALEQPPRGRTWKRADACVRGTESHLQPAQHGKSVIIQNVEKMCSCKLLNL